MSEPHLAYASLLLSSGILGNCTSRLHSRSGSTGSTITAESLGWLWQNGTLLNCLAVLVSCEMLIMLRRFSNLPFGRVLARNLALDVQDGNSLHRTSKLVMIFCDWYSCRLDQTNIGHISRRMKVLPSEETVRKRMNANIWSHPVLVGTLSPVFSCSETTREDSRRTVA